MMGYYPMQRIRASDTQMWEDPPRTEENGTWIKSPNSPDFPNQSQIWWPLDGTYNALGEPNPKVT